MYYYNKRAHDPTEIVITESRFKIAKLSLSESENIVMDILKNVFFFRKEIIPIEILIYLHFSETTDVKYG